MIQEWYDRESAAKRVENIGERVKVMTRDSC